MLHFKQNLDQLELGPTENSKIDQSGESDLMC